MPKSSPTPGAKKVTMNESTKAIDAAPPASQNMSLEELIAQRTIAHSQPEEPVEEVPEEAQPEEEVPETPEPEQAPEEPAEDEPEPEDEEDGEPDIDLLSLTTEQIQELAKKGKSRLLHRIGELTAQKKALEEQVQAAKAETKPLVPQIPAEENPFRELKTLEEISAKHQELEKVAEETDRILEDHEDYGADDIITVGGKEFSKKDIRMANRNARTAMTRFLPAQAQAIQLTAAYEQMETQLNAAIPAEVPEIADEESEVSKLFKAMMDDPLVKQAKERVPGLAPQIGYLLAHAANSLSKKAKVQVKPATGNIGKAKVPPTPSGAAARTSQLPRKQQQAAYQQFEQTGRVEDWIAARIAKHSTT